MRPGFQVVASVVHHPDEPPRLLPEVLLTYMVRHFDSITAAKKACRRKEVMVQGKVCTTGRMVHPGERVEWLQRVQGGHQLGRQLQAHAAPVKLEVVYEDDHMACIVKPPGLPTQGIRGEPDLQQCLPYALRPTQEIGVLWRPQHVHRLDVDTGGLVSVAKTRLAMQVMSRAFQKRQVRKTYSAVVMGHLEGKGVIDVTLDTRPALTEYAVIQHGAVAGEGGAALPTTLVRLNPHTGRTHQLRRHMALLGHPILGDRRYTGGYCAAQGRRGCSTWTPVIIG
eukprot:jgi/Astpho2/3231/Aster-x1132